MTDIATLLDDHEDHGDGVPDIDFPTADKVAKMLPETESSSPWLFRNAQYEVYQEGEGETLQLTVRRRGGLSRPQYSILLAGNDATVLRDRLEEASKTMDKADIGPLILETYEAFMVEETGPVRARGPRP